MTLLPFGLYLFVFLIQYYQLMLDKFTPHLAVRWIATVVLGALYVIRILYVQVCSAGRADETETLFAPLRIAHIEMKA